MKAVIRVRSGFLPAFVLFVTIGLIGFSCGPLPVDVAPDTNHAPVIILLGRNIDTVAPATPYVEPGATATDIEDGNLSDSIYVYDGEFDRQSPVVGTYALYYLVQDNGGLLDTAIRTVVVKAGAISTSDTIVIRDPASGSTTYTDTTKIYLLPDSRFTIPAGAAVTFGAKVRVIGMGKILVQGTLVIDTGAVFLMGKDACIETYSGKLTVAGSDSFPVIFKNLTPGVFWGNDNPNSSSVAWASYGISVSVNANGASSIRNCIVDSATTGINIAKDGLLLSNIAVASCKYTGIYFDACGPKDSTTFTNINYLDNGSSVNYYPLVIHAEYLGRLSTSQTFRANAVNAVLVMPGVVVSSGNWKALDVPYVVNSGSYIRIDNANGVVTTVAAGAQFKFMVGSYIEVRNGTFIANGTPSKHIQFDTWVAGTKWGNDYGTGNYSANYGIYFALNATSACSMSYCDLDNVTQGITVYDSPVQIANCSFSNTKFYGLYATAVGKAGVNVGSCTFINNGAGSYYLAP